MVNNRNISKPIRGILILFLIAFQFGLDVYAQDLYVQTFGVKSAVPVIYLHGGPGYNSASFERTSAQELADEGYFVVVYDRRGEGRSADPDAKYSFKQSHSDLLALIDSLGLKEVNLLGHSFGGMLAVSFAEKHKDIVRSITLASAPVSLQESFKTIIASCEQIYIDKNDKTNLSYIKMLKAMDSSSVQYSSFCFMHAMQNGFYSPKNPSSDAEIIYDLFRSDSVLLKYASQMGYKQPQGFWKNDAYTSMDLSESIAALAGDGIKIYGIYGKEDGLYSAKQIADLEAIIGDKNVLYLDDCSHSVFIDQQRSFMDELNKWLK